MNRGLIAGVAVALSVPFGFVACGGDVTGVTHDGADAATSDGIDAGGADGSSSDAGTTAADAGSPYAGQIGLTWGQSRSFFFGSFYNAAAWAALCTRTVVGTCSFNSCRSDIASDGGVIVPAVSAGTLTISGGSTASSTAFPQPLVIPYDPSASYDYSLHAATVDLGETLTFTASGAEVAAFSVTTGQTPAYIMVTSPAVTTPIGDAGDLGFTLDETHDLTVTWTGGSAGSKTEVQLSADGAGNLANEVDCFFDGAGGTGSVPSSLLTKLGAVEGLFTVTPESAPATASAANAELTATIKGVGTLGTTADAPKIGSFTAN